MLHLRKSAEFRSRERKLFESTLSQHKLAKRERDFLQRSRLNLHLRGGHFGTGGYNRMINEEDAFRNTLISYKTKFPNRHIEGRR